MAYLPTPPSESNVPACEATVYVPTPLHPTAEAEASKRFKHVLRPGVDGLTEADCLARSDAILLRIGKAKKLQLDQAPKLRIISRSGVGCDDIDLDICRARGIRVTNCPGENAKVVAELALTLALAVVRRVKEMDARIRSGEIVPSIYALCGSLFGATVGLIGMGDIAYSLAQLLKPFDCKILVFSPTSDSKRWTSEDDRYAQAIPHTRVDSLEELCREVDILSIHCPLKPSTRNLISATELSWMKPSAIIINTARGGIIDEPALATALKEGRLGGAGLDVFESEPAHGETLGDLGKLPNVICLPHLGGSTDAIALSSTMMAVDIASGYLDGKGIRNVVV